MSTSTSALTVQREDLNPCTVLLTISCPPELVRAGFQRAYKDLGKRVRIPGFRPGHAPQHLLRNAIPREQLLNAAAEVVVRDAYQQALEQEKLTPEGNGAVEMESFDEDKHECKFKAKVPLPAIVELADYNGIPLTKSTKVVTDEDVERQLEELRGRSGKREAVTDRGVQEGDMVVVNLKPKTDTGEGRTMMVQVGQSFKDLDKALVGMEAEQMKSVKLTFPDDYSTSAWAGQKMDVDVTVRSVSSVRVPELDDAFAKSMNVENVDDLKARVREALERAHEDSATKELDEQILLHLTQESKIEVADNTWEQVLSRRLQDVQPVLQTRKSNIEEYVKANGMTVEEFVERLKEEAKMHVKRAVIIERVFKAEDLKITDQEATKHFLQIAMENGVPEDQIEAFAREYGNAIRDEVIYRAMYSLVMEQLRAKANIGEGEAKPKAAKKAAKAEPAAEAKAEKPKSTKAKAEKADDAEAKPKKAPAKKDAKK